MVSSESARPPPLHGCSLGLSEAAALSSCHTDEEEEEEDSGSQSVEISSSLAQGGAGLAMGCVSGDKEERDSRAEDRATDSGIDRGQGSSRAASAEGWLARLTSRVRHSSPGSTPDLHTRHR